MKESMFGNGKAIIPFVDLGAQNKEAKAEIDSAIERIMTSSSFITGPIVEEFENTMIGYTGAEDCASIGSGTNALLCALRATIQPGDEVITVAHTFVSTTEAIVLAGGIPVFVDIGDYYCIDIDQIEHKINNKTKAILFVDLYGQTPDISQLKYIAEKHNLTLIEDAAQAFGSSYKGAKVGSLSDLTCFSFNPVKNLGAIGDAGMVTGKKDLIEKVKMYRDHGRSQKFIYDKIGYNARIDNIQALVVQAKLPFLANWTEGKREVCHRYTESLKGYVDVPIENPDSYHTYYVYVIKVAARDKLQNFLKDRGIATNTHYKNPTHRTPAYEPWTASLPVTEKAADSIISLPCYHTLKREQQQYIVDSIKEFYDQY